MAGTKARDPSGAGPSSVGDRSVAGGMAGGGSKGSQSGSRGTKARDPSGAGPDTVTDRSVAGGSYSGSTGKQTQGGSPGGGTTTSYTYSPGAVGNYPDADVGTVAEQALKALPGGMLLGAAEQFTDDGSLLGNPGPQKGYQPDKFKGAANMTGVGDPGSASGLSADEREIAGQSYGAGTNALTGDSGDDSVVGGGTDAIWSDVTLQDRRKPKGLVGAGTQMVLG